MTGEKYIDQARNFLQSLADSLTQVTLVSLALPLTSVAATLNDDQVPPSCNLHTFVTISFQNIGSKINRYAKAP